MPRNAKRVGRVVRKGVSKVGAGIRSRIQKSRAEKAEEKRLYKEAYKEARRKELVSDARRKARIDVRKGGVVTQIGRAILGGKKRRAPAKKKKKKKKTTRKKRRSRK